MCCNESKELADIFRGWWSETSDFRRLWFFLVSSHSKQEQCGDGERCLGCRATPSLPLQPPLSCTGTCSPALLQKAPIPGKSGMSLWQRHGAVGFRFQAGVNIHLGAGLLLCLLFNYLIFDYFFNDVAVTGVSDRLGCC